MPARRLEALAAAPGPRTFDNTMRALDDLTEPLDYAMGVIRHLESVATYPELRAAFNAAQPAVSAFYSGIPLHEGLWKGLKEFAATPEGSHLTGPRRRFLVKTMDAFRRHGAELDPAGKKRLEELDVELTKLTTKYSENVLDSTNRFELVIEDEARLAGLPPSALESARESAKRKNKEGWRFTLQAPDYTAVMTYLDDAAIRRTVYEAYSVRATEGEHDNRQIIARILELRREKARLLGFANFADLVLEDRMAHTGARALGFLEDLKTKTERALPRRESRAVRVSPLHRRRGCARTCALGCRLLRREAARRALRLRRRGAAPLLPAGTRGGRLVDPRQSLYGIRVTEEANVPVWDEHVKFYNIHDEDGAFLGGFYADWYPRENKRGGAWMDGLLTGGPVADGFKPHLGLICGNLTPPIGDKPALLTHREVETIFHEFGHLLHHLLSRVEIRSHGGHQRRVGFRRAALADHGELVLGARRARSVRAPLANRRARARAISSRK